MNARLKKAIENADGQQLWECRECGTYWPHVGDFRCPSCGSKDADEVPSGSSDAAS